jgi:putative DNA primase/helicase
MNAAMIAAALGDARREGRAWRCRCPLHAGRSLVLRDGDDGRLLATCWGGCDRLAVLTELRRRGLLRGGADNTARDISAALRNEDVARRVARALAIWSGAERGAGTIVARYLASRGITLDHWPESLRFHPRCPRPRDEVENFLPRLPAMVALVEHIERGPVAVHCTYLRPNGAGKAEIQKRKAMFGPVAGGAVRFGMPLEGQWFAVAEGIETALSIAVACSMPAWAALSAAGMKHLSLPGDATHVVICADHDPSRTGERAAHDAAARWLAEGRAVRIAMPPEPGADFNDILNGGAGAEKNEHRHVAA